MSKTKIFLATLAGFAGVVWSYADSAKQDEVYSLKARVAALESSMGKAPAQKGTTGVMSSLYNVDFYGYVKADAEWASKVLSSGTNGTWDNAANYVPYDTTTLYDRNQFAMTANQTRLGFNIKGPEALDGKLSAVIEGDFWSTFRLRHAYVKWVKDDWAVWAGQTWYVLWGAGASKPINFNSLTKEGELAADRAPQLGVSKLWKWNDDVKTMTKVAINQGENASSGLPHLQAYADVQFKMLTDKVTKVSASAVYGREKRPTVTEQKAYSVWGIVGGLELPLAEWLTLTAQIYYGKNLAKYGGAMKHAYSSGMNTDSSCSIKEFGGFAQACIYPIEKVTVVVGAGCAAPKYGNVETSATGGITSTFRNSIIFANVNYDFTKALCAGIEYAYLHTKYKASSTETLKRGASRLQAAVTFKF